MNGEEGDMDDILLFYAFSIHLKLRKMESFGKKYRPSERIAHTWSFHVRSLLAGVRREMVH